MGEILVKQFDSDKDIGTLGDLLKEAWGYYVHEVDSDRLNDLLKYYLTDDTKKFLMAFEDKNLIGIAEITIMESYRYPGEEGRLELLYIRDEASNYYDVHSGIMNKIFSILKDEKIEYLRVDTTLENADVMMV